jgi:hypothetical protein
MLAAIQSRTFIFSSAVTNTKLRIYKTMMLPLILYGCETWSQSLRGKHRLGVFENRVLKKIFGLKSDEVTGVWRKVHNKVLRDLYSLSSIIGIIKSRRMKGGRGM